MMKRIWTLLLALCLLCLPVLALADSTMKVQGAATVSVEPDMAVLRVGHSSERPDSSEAQAETAQAIEAIAAALLALAIEEDDIVTSSLYTYPVYDYAQNGAQSIRGYRVEHMLSITLRDIGLIGTALDAAIGAGANEIQNVDYRSSEEKEVYKQALALATQDAADKAEALSIATGVWLGGLQAVEELTGSAVPLMAKAERYDVAGAGGASASTGSSLRTGSIEISASVELTYEIR